MPCVPSRVGDHGHIVAAERGDDQRETAVGEGWARRERLPRADRHGGGADAEDGAGAFAENEGANRREIDVELFDALENCDAGFVVERGPSVSVIGGAEQADLHAGGGGVDQQQRRVAAKELAKARHPLARNAARRWRASAQRAESKIDRIGGRPSVPDSTNENPFLILL